VGGSARRPALRALAERLGILSAYQPAGGGPPKRTSDATREALVSALGWDASDEAAARRSLSRVAESERAAPAPRPVSPAPVCVDAWDALGGSPGFGLWSNLYTVRSDTGLGVGNTGDLESLVDLAASAGASFVGVNPLHAVRHRGREVSPYSPISRFFRSPIYLDALRTPEWAGCAEARGLFDAPRFAGARRRLTRADDIDYDATRSLQEELLAPLHREFARAHRGRDTPRGRAYARFVDAGGALLRDFGTFLALEDHLAHEGHPRSWQAWPAAFRERDSRAVREFRAHHEEEVDRHLWTQFELERQLEGVARRAREAGLALGVYQDLALGSVPSGFDTWAFPGAFVEGVSLGAPPDAYATQGQDWGLPPFHPQRLAADDFALWRRLLRAAFAASGALRIDHILGLFRQWWVPAGAPASEGAYVRFPTAALLRVLAEESRRADAVVIGEDLGTVPPQVAPTLARHGVLSSRVMLFERDRRGRFRPASRYSRRALATFDTHDLPPLAGFWEGSDLALRRELGLIASDAELAQARAERDAEREALCARLATDGHLPRGGGEPSLAELCAALNAFLCRTPCPLVGVSLDDLAGEHRPVNVPGVSQDVHPSWTRRMSRSLVELASDADVEQALAGAASRARKG